MTRRRWMLIVLSVVLVALVGIVIWQYTPVPSNSAPPPYRVFCGRVVDQDGNPLRDAEVVVTTYPLADNFLYPGHPAPDRGQQSTYSTYSGVTGTFLVTMGQPKHCLEILDVKLPGYTWLIDWKWTLPTDEYQQGQTRAFDLGGPRSNPPIYTPDTNNLAVFVLVKDGYDKPIAAMPSRGGSDQWEHRGPSITNHPQPVAIPSTGPSAPPRNHVDQAIRDYLDSKGIPQIHPATDATRPSR